jgi:2-C-methyl-D-erythritol 4-phosphate cytidylyltransferase
MESARSSLDLGQVILVVPTDRREELAAALGSVALPGPKVEVVAGGPRRADSVRAALRALGDGGLGPVGARADIAAHCVALLVPAGE